MRQTFQTLCAIEQQHAYFQNPQTPSLRVTPTSDTAHRLQRVGLWLKATAGALVVLRTRAADEEPAPLPDFVFPLRFALQPLAANFANFTDLPAPAEAPAAGARAVFFFRARAGKAVGSSFLSELAGQDAVRLPLTPLTLTFPTGLRPDSRAGVQLLDMARRQTRHRDLPVDETGCVAVDLRPWGPGRYRLRVGTTVLLDFYADDQLYAAQTWGVLEISAAALTRGSLRIRLAFAARRTFWRYVLRYQHAATAHYRQQPESLTVTAAARNGTELPPVRFTPAPPPPGADAAFVSTEAIALAERPGYTCTLGSTVPAPLVVALLPAAAPDVLPRPGPRGAATTDIPVHL